MASDSVRIRFVLAVLVALVAADAGAACRIMLVPGAACFINNDEYFADYRRFFAERGCETAVAGFPADATIEERALALRDQTARFAGKNGRIVMIAHSQGGLDARFALKTLKMKKVSALVTVASPHEGAPVAGWARRQARSHTAVYWLLRVLGGYDLAALRFAPQLESAFLKANASRFGRAEGVAYASARCICVKNCHLSLRLASWLTGAGAGPGEGDGLVPGSAQMLGDDLGTFDLDHLAEVAPTRKGVEERSRMIRKIWEHVAPHLESRALRQ
ncbi:MAG: hypothetical protein A2583_01000 [Bdellovibrionales bacterium RIFOXYD1_FULL_53_11]|nr:MAG: hypothetical protein A2583_01000 [Bdellovibrionales bacterium RIFOXYD1_FULL_53_11]